MSLRLCYIIVIYERGMDNWDINDESFIYSDDKLLN